MEQEISEDLRDQLDSFATFGEAKAALIDAGRWRALKVLYDEANERWDIGDVDRNQLLDLLVEMAESEQDDSERSKIYRAAGEAAAATDGADKRAKKLFRESFRADTSNVGTLERARELYRRDGDTSTIKKLYELEFKVTDSAERRADILTRYAQALGEYERDFDAAVDKLTEALELVDDHPYAHRTRQIYLNESTLEDELVARAERADSLYQQGEDDSAASIWTEVGAMECFREGGATGRATAWLERAASIRVDDRLREVLQRFDVDGIDIDREDGTTRTDATDEPADTVPEQTAVTQQLTDVEPDPSSEESDEPGGAESADASADGDELPPIDDGAEAQTLGGESSVLEGRSIYDHIEPWSGSVEDAFETLEHHPDNLSAFAAVRAHLRDTSEWEQLVDVLERTLRYLRKEEGEAELMAELASIYWKKLGDIERAEYYFKRLKLLDAEHPEVFSFYEAYYERKEKWRKLFSLLSKRQRNLSDPSEIRRLARRRAEIAEVQIGSADKAIDVWKEYLRQSNDPDARLELRRLYEENQKWNSLVDFLKAEVDRLETRQDEQDAATVDERIDLLEEMADLYEEELELESMAIKSLRKIVRLDPEHIPAFERLRDKLVDARRWSDLLEVIVDRAEQAREDGRIDRAVELFREGAELANSQLNDVERASELLETALDLDLSRSDIREQLADIYRSRHAHDSLFALRQRELDQVEGSARLSLLREMADIARDHINDPEREIECLEEIRALDADDLDALERLENRYRDRQDWRALVDVLDDQARAVRDLRREADIQVAKARLQIEELDRADAAVDTLRRALDAEPDHVEALDRLTELYIDQNRFEALVDLYLDRGEPDHLVDLLMSAAGDADRAAQRELYRLAADIAEEELRDASRVVDALEPLLAVAEHPPDIARRLVDWYDQLGRLDDEIDTRRLILDAGAPDEVDRDHHLTRLAELESRRDRPEAALRWQNEAVRHHPGDLDLRTQARQYAQAAGAISSYVEVLEEIEPELPDPERIDVLEERARLTVQDLDDPEAAVDIYEELADLAPDEARYLAELCELNDQLDRPAELADSLAAWIDIRRDEGASREWLVEQLGRLADIRLDRLDNSEAAREALEQALQVKPDSLDLLRRLRQLDREEENWRRVADLLRREFGILEPGDSERAEVAFELATLCREKLDDPEDAVRYFDETLEATPDDSRAVEAMNALLDLLDHDEVAGQAARVLEPAVRRAGRMEALTDVLETRLSLLDDPFDRLDVLDDLVELYDSDLDRPARAFDLAAEQFQLDPDREFVWDRLERLAEATDRWQTLDDIVAPTTPISEEGDDSELAYKRLRRLARWRTDQFEDNESAVRAWETIRRRDPMDGEAITSLESLYRELEAAEPLAEILERRAELASDAEERAELKLEVARLHENPLSDADRAIPRYEDVLDNSPGNDEAFGALERLYDARERWFDLEELWENRLRHTDDADHRLDLECQLVNLQSRQLDDPAGAVTRMTRLLADSPSDERVLRTAEDLDEALEEQGSERRIELARSLEPVYRDNEDHEQLADVLALQLEGERNDPYARLDILDELTDLRLGHLGRREAAFDSLKQAVRIEPDNAERRERLEKLGRSLDRLPEVVDVLEAAAGEADAFAAAPIYRAVGRLAEEIDEDQRSIAAFERALDIDESDRTTLTALEDLYAQSGQTAALTDNLRRQLEFADPDERADLLSRIATLEKEVLGRPDRSREALEEWLNIEPSNMRAITLLETLNRGEERWHDLADLLRGKIDVVEEDGKKLEALRELGGLEHRKLGSPDDAIETYRHVLELDPGAADALDALETLYESTERWRELQEVLDQKLQKTSDEGESRRKLSMKLADLCRVRLDEKPRAVALYGEVLSSQNATPGALEALEELVEDPEVSSDAANHLEQYYRRENRWEDLASLLRTRARQTDAPERSAELWMAAGRVLENHVGDLESAAEVYGRAWRRAPDTLDDVRNDARDALRRLCAAEERWSPWVDAAHDVLDQLHDADRRIELHWELGETHLEELQDPVEAEDQFRAIIDLEPTAYDAYDRLDTLLSRQDRWLDLVDLLEKRDEIERDDEHVVPSADRLVRIAELYEEELEDRLSAVETWERLLEREPDHRRAREALVRLYREQGRWEDLAGRLEDEIDRGNADRQTIDYMQELAGICTEHLLDLERAVDLYDRILQRRPNYDEVIESLERVYQEFESVRLDASQVLERIYRRRESWESLVELLAERSELQATDDPSEPLAEGRRVAREYLGDADWTYALGLQLHTHRPNDEELLADLREETAELDRWPQLADHLAEVIAESEGLEPRERADLEVELADIHETRLEDLGEARSLLLDVLLEVPDHADAIDRMERLLWREEAWTDLADFYRERIDAVETDSDAIPWLRRLGGVYELMEDDTTRAVETYRELLSIDPADAQAEATVEQLYAEEGRWHDLTEFYRSRADQVDDDERRRELQHRLARTLAGDLHDIDTAIDVYEAILNEARSRTETIRAAEGLLRDLQRRGGWEQQRRRLLDVVLACVESESEWRRRLDLLDHRLMVVDEPARRAETHREQADLLLEYGEDGVERIPAVEHATRAYCLQFDEASWSFLQETARSLDGWHRVPAAVLSMLGDVPDADDRARLLITAGDIYRDHLDDRPSAVEAYREALDQGAPETAITRLEGELEQMQAWDALADTLSERLEAADDPEVEHQLLQRLAILHDQQLARPDAAIDYYERLVDRDPSNRDHVAALDTLYHRTGDYEALRDLCEQQIGLADDDEERAEWMSRLASVQHEFLDQSEAALETYRSLREIAPDREEAVDAMASLLREMGRWEDLVDLLEERRDGASEAVGQLDPVELNVEIAHVEATHLSRPERALDRLEGIVADHPDHEAARDKLGQLTTHAEVGDAAKQVLLDLFERQDDRAAWRDFLKSRTDALDDPDRRGDAFIELADFHIEHGDGPRRACGVLLEAVRDLPAHDPVRRRLRKTAEAVDSVEDIVATYEELVERSLPPEDSAAIHAELADLYADHGDEIGKAIRHAKSARELRPDDKSILDLLDKLYQQSGNWNALADILEARLERADRGELTDVRFRLAYLHENMFDEHQTAFDYYREVLTDEPDHGGALKALERMIDQETLDESALREALQRLEELYRKDEADAKLAELLEIKASYSDDPIDRASVLEEVGDIRSSLDADPEVVFRLYAKALRSDPLSDELQQKLEDVATAHGLEAAGIDVLEEMLEVVDDPIRREDIALRAGRWSLDALEEPERASTHFRTVLDGEPDHEEALEGLEAALRKLDADQELIDVLERRVDQIHQPDEQKNLLLELSDLHRDAGNLDAAVDAAERALDCGDADVDVLERLVDLLSNMERPARYVDSLERLAEVTEGDDEAAALFIRACDVCDESLDATDRAISFAQRALDRVDVHLDALKRLGDLYRRMEAWDDVDDVLRQRLDRAESRQGRESDEALDITVRLGRLAADHRDRPDEAADWFEKALDIDPRHPGAVRALQTLYAREGRTDELMAIWERQLEMTDDEARRRRLYCDMAITSVRDLEDPERGRDYLEQASALGDEAPEVLRARRVFFEQQDDWVSVLEVLDREIEAAADQQDWRDLMHRRAEIQRQELDREEDALETLHTVAREIPGDGETFEQALELAQQRDDIRRVCKLHQLRAERADSREKQVESLTRVADLAENELDDMELAAAALDGAHDAAPEDTELTERLIDLLLELGAAEQAEPLIAELIELYDERGNTESLVSLQHRRGRLAEARGEVDEALDIYQQVHERDASYVPNLLSLSTLAIENERWELAREISEKLLLHQMSLETDAQKVRVYYNLGRVRRHNGDERRAGDMFNRALNIDPDHEPSERALDEMEG